ncbi:MAG: hypothetical protein IEMM0002_0010 [bacterium]|nr:MAG: hypothetical protein IEMM0002_0010 [bacterium]
MIARIFLVLSLSAGVSNSSYGTEIDLSKLRNPFEFGKARPAVKKRKMQKKKKIAGMIIIKGDQTVAMINGKTYRVGDTFDGSQIISISLEFLELSSEISEKRIYLK